MVSKSKRRKERKRRAALAGKRAQEEAKRTEESDPSATALNVLANPDDDSETKSDLVLVEMSLRWQSDPDEKQEIKNRLMGVVRKTEVRVVGKDGEVHSVDGPADVNAMKAADIFLKCEAQNQKDEHFEKRQANPKKPSQTQFNIGVNIGTDERREKLSAIASRIGIDFVPEGGTTSEADGDSDAAVRIRNPKEGDGS